LEVIIRTNAELRSAPVGVSYKKPSHTTDSELTDDVIARYEGEDVVGYTILHASQRDLRP
jgi:hypothetical protein